jgi:hypothetical protein
VSILDRLGAAVTAVVPEDGLSSLICVPGSIHVLVRDHLRVTPVANTSSSPGKGWR